jgi:3-methyladenine DNA glycosylase/8-oxoguanine DNA glycosylase
MSSGSPDAQLTWRPYPPPAAATTLSSLRRGAGDPTHRLQSGGVVWRTARTPLGPATLRLTPTSTCLEAAAWGDGADWAIASVPDLLGACDDPSGFRPRHPLLRESHRRHLGMRIPRCGLVLEMLVPAVLEQKVTGPEARRAWHDLLRWYGEPAPGPAPAGMRVFPPPEVWARIPSWDWHRAGVDPQRSRTIVAAARVAGRLEETLDLPPAEADRRLRSIPGVGVWTSAEVRQRAHGDADAVSVGDFHIPALVGWALLGRPLDDAAMLEVLAPYAPHRHRVVRLLEISGFRLPRFGPRMPVRDYRDV